MGHMKDEFVTREEAAALLGGGVGMVWNLQKSRRLTPVPASRAGDNRLRIYFRTADVEAILREREVREEAIRARRKQAARMMLAPADAPEQLAGDAVDEVPMGASA